MGQFDMVQGVSAQPTLRSILGGNMAQQMSGDAFAMIFQQMMDGDLLAQLAQSLQKDEEEIGAQMAAEMMSIMPNMQPDMLFPMLQGTEMNVQNLRLELEQENPHMQKLQEFFSAIKTEDVQEIAEVTKKLTPDEFYTVLSSVWKEQPTQPIDFRLQGDAVRAAKQMLDSEEKHPVEALDIESLQLDVDAKRFLPTDRIMQKEELIQTNTEEIVNQVKTGILDNVAKGKSEFVIRLKPEGIGEIVVKMSEDKSHISLKILTASTQTAKLISNEVTALQNALRPLHAEVQQISVVPENQLSEYTTQTGMTNQDNHFAGQQFANQNHDPSNRPKNQQDVEFGSAMQSTLEDDGLDTYI